MFLCVNSRWKSLSISHKRTYMITTNATPKYREFMLLTATGREWSTACSPVLNGFRGHTSGATLGRRRNYPRQNSEASCGSQNHPRKLSRLCSPLTPSRSCRVRHSYILLRSPPACNALELPLNSSFHVLCHIPYYPPTSKPYQL